MQERRHSAAVLNPRCTVGHLEDVNADLIGLSKSLHSRSFENCLAVYRADRAKHHLFDMGSGSRAPGFESLGH